MTTRRNVGIFTLLMVLGTACAVPNPMSPDADGGVSQQEHGVPAPAPPVTPSAVVPVAGTPTPAAPPPAPAPATAPAPASATAPAPASAGVAPVAGPVGAVAGSPFVDVGRIPAPLGGASGVVLIPGAVPSSNPEGVGTFRFDCAVSHMAFDDPIVAPGRPGGSHLHTYFGNTAVDAFSTSQSIATTGNSTCRGGTANRSGYWVPTMIDTSNGAPIAPAYLQLYYKTGYNGVRPADVTVVPAGLRMIAGNSRATGPGSAQHKLDYECQTTQHGQLYPAIPRDCAPGELMNMQINFPQCWDGVNLDSPDHQSHMAEASSGCPGSHPVAIPAITFNVKYLVPASGTSTWRLSSDAYDASQPAGYSGHADWWNGWNEDIIRTVTQNCLQRALECHMDLMGDGRALG